MDGAEWGPIASEIRELDPKALKPQTVNARFMTAAQMEQLTENVKRDGRLTSTVLAYQPPGSEDLEILSGHHRAEASRAAGLGSIRVEVITSPLTEQRKVALQLSHNAITGQDDPATLAAMYAGLDLSARTYSGLDDSALGALKDVGLAGLSIGVEYQEMRFSFLPEDAEAVTRALGDLEKAGRKNPVHVVAYRDFDVFFDLAVKAKAKLNAVNSATAMRMLIDLAIQKLEEIEADRER